MEKIVGELFEIVKSLVLAAERRGEAVDKAIKDRLSAAERGLYEARKAAHEAESAADDASLKLAAALRAAAPPLPGV